jgi:hypothetical protein
MDRDCAAVDTIAVETQEGFIDETHRCGLYEDHLGSHICRSCGRGWS